ncbi:MAG: hypothetical protein JNK76_08315, partial [Planctomycetales bacterium]|nr:hypothetical protein [Planctomycetales bacterium]
RCEYSRTWRHAPGQMNVGSGKLAAVSITMAEIADRRQDFSGDIPAAAKSPKRNGRIQK